MTTIKAYTLTYTNRGIKAIAKAVKNNVFLHQKFIYRVLTL